MQLTTQMIAEAQTIETRVRKLIDEVWHPMEKEMSRAIATPEQATEAWAKANETAVTVIAELNPYKIRLENILCETDIKEQARSPMKLRIVYKKINMCFYPFQSLNLELV